MYTKSSLVLLSDYSLILMFYKHSITLMFLVQSLYRKHSFRRFETARLL